MGIAAWYPLYFQLIFFSIFQRTGLSDRFFFYHFRKQELLNTHSGVIIISPIGTSHQGPGFHSLDFLQLNILCRPIALRQHKCYLPFVVYSDIHSNGKTNKFESTLNGK